MRKVVDLPAPFGPRKPVTVPGSHLNETSSTALIGPKCLLIPCTSIIDGIDSTGGRTHAGRPPFA